MHCVNLADHQLDPQEAAIWAHWMSELQIAESLSEIFQPRAEDIETCPQLAERACSEGREWPAARSLLIGSRQKSREHAFGSNSCIDHRTLINAADKLFHQYTAFRFPAKASLRYYNGILMGRMQRAFYRSNE